MPNRVIKDTILTSPSINGLSVWAERHFYRLLLVVDDYGCFEATPAVIRGRCYALQRATEAQVVKWHGELEAAGVVNFWEEDGRTFGVFVKFDKHNSKYCVTDEGKPTRHRRRTPEPPEEVLATFCQTLPNPNPNPKHNPKHNPKPKEKAEKIFDAWNSHPNIRPKHRVLNKPTEQAINARLERFTPDEVCTAINNYGDSTDKFWIEWREVKRGWSLEQFLSRGEGLKVDKFLDGPINEEVKSAKRAYPCRDAAKYEGKPVCKKLQEWDGRGSNPCDGCGDYTP